MHAMVLSEFGPPDVLLLRVVADPAPGAHDVLVRVHATSVNAVDCRIRRGERAVALPAVLGYDVSGVVIAIGAEVEDFMPGDEVFYAPELYTSDGSYAEYHVAREEIVAHKPANLSHAEAATLPLAAGTAWDALVTRAAVEIGETVLILGGGDVALFAIQIARAAGAAVFVACPPELGSLAMRLGATRTIDVAAERVADVIAAESADALVDLVFDTTDSTPLEQSVNVTRAGGRIASTFRAIGEASGESVFRNITHHSVSPRPDRERLAMICAVAERGQLVPVIDAVLRLEEAADAHRRAEAGGLRGKLVLEVV
jgi:NADPH:quinone reductase-like Zn-dependent oxidoreductase